MHHPHHQTGPRTVSTKGAFLLLICASSELVVYDSTIYSMEKYKQFAVSAMSFTSLKRFFDLQIIPKGGTPYLRLVSPYF